jgi:hypothetical protein
MKMKSLLCLLVLSLSGCASFAGSVRPEPMRAPAVGQWARYRDARSGTSTTVRIMRLDPSGGIWVQSERGDGKKQEALIKYANVPDGVTRLYIVPATKGGLPPDFDAWNFLIPPRVIWGADQAIAAEPGSGSRLPTGRECRTVRWPFDVPAGHFEDAIRCICSDGESFYSAQAPFGGLLRNQYKDGSVIAELEAFGDS